MSAVPDHASITEMPAMDEVDDVQGAGQHG
jgi:hypothetical protein